MKQNLPVAIIADVRYTQHLTGPGQPESPARTTSIIKALEDAGLKTSQNTLLPREATDQEILLCHTPAYLQLVKDEIKLCASSPWQDGSLCLSTGDVQISPASLEIARLAVGGALVAVDAVMQQKAASAFCVVRPPGHHACSNLGMGFCLFNNIAIAARYAQKHYQIERVLIVDWDIHHGNGTQEIFEEDPTVFYFSTHRAHYYPPGTGLAKQKGVGKGLGTVMNFPIEAGPLDREEVINAIQNNLKAAMKSFKPQLVLISAGFDAHHRDPIGGFHLTEDDFAILTHSVQEIANAYAGGKLISILEGGYDLVGLAASAVSHVKALI